MKKLQEELNNFDAFLLEKEMLIVEELGQGQGDSFYHGAFTWINAIRHEFRNQFKEYLINEKEFEASDKHIKNQGDLA